MGKELATELSREELMKRGLYQTREVMHDNVEIKDGIFLEKEPNGVALYKRIVAERTKKQNRQNGKEKRT